ncbi:MAG: Na+-transporting methylmalonyl-CoA/oxaloacetate decarboxylase gamma subunit [Saprospiraceae bacterium]|jgi:Na+-transporting methylmalonyl-CoA/oxaloacetate decarboxylase gamma subunit
MSIERMIKVSRVNPLFLLLGVAVFFVVLFWLAKGIFTLLSWAFPAFLVGALIINYRVVLGYVKWLFSSLKRNPVFGIIAIVLSVIGIPFVSVFLFMRALATRGMDQSSTSLTKIGNYIPYEEVEDDFLDLSEIEAQKKSIDNEYSDIFK